MVRVIIRYLQIAKTKLICLIGVLSISMSLFWYPSGVEIAIGEDLPIRVDKYMANSEGKVKLTPSAALFKKTNLILNGGFENGKTGWTGKFKIVDEKVLQGGKACQLSSTSVKRQN